MWLPKDVNLPNSDFKKAFFRVTHIISLAVFNPILEKLLESESFGYPINDFNLITTNKRTHQRNIFLDPIHEPQTKAYEMQVPVYCQWQTHPCRPTNWQH